MPALLGGLFIGVLSALPIINCCCCLWISGGGVLAAYLQQQNQPASLTMPQGARVGLLAGIVGAFVWLVTNIGAARRCRRASSASCGRPRPAAERSGDARSGRGRRPWRQPVRVRADVVLWLDLATIGGMVGAAYFRKDVPPALGGPIHPPPLP